MKALAPGTVIFHRYRGYGVITAVNLLTGWISARFGNESRTLDLNLSTDEVQFADGEAILFRRAPPDRMPQQVRTRTRGDNTSFPSPEHCSKYCTRAISSISCYYRNNGEGGRVR